MLGDRSSFCGLLGDDFVGQEVFLQGWVRSRRDHGGLIFIDLGDYTGKVQTVVEPDKKEQFALAEAVRSEYVLAIRGTVRPRPEGTENKDVPSGTVEVLISEIELLSEAQTPPFFPDDDDVGEDLRLKYRFVDLRRQVMQDLLRTRHQIYRSVRGYLDNAGFCELETPILSKTTPEGARDFLVPSRLSPGRFYALPQSPQLYKQVLMCSGFNAYYQIVKCFRDEDFRANRQPEFTQIDIEASFIREEHIRELIEGLLVKIWKDAEGCRVKYSV